ncbi:MAG: carboxypeptidase-like regulatory domain-containing protein [Flavobacteriaceae bacterium]|nr:carboxypeptidase-like regulatory domain-containing protein [Flavobacteriaceae bacterium]
MRTQSTNQKRRNFRTLNILGLFVMFMLACTTIQAQETNTNEKVVKGVISDEDGPLPNVNIVLKGTLTGIVTDENGEFTFPKALKEDDVLTITYIGYETQNIKIGEGNNFLDLTLTQDQIEMIGALDSGTPFKTKRSN